MTSGGFNKKVLIPTIACLSALLILTAILVFFVIRKSYIRRKTQRTHGRIEDDYSSASSLYGPCRGPSVREGKLVRNASRSTLGSRKGSKNGIKATAESVKDGHELFAAMQNMSKLEEGGYRPQNLGVNVTTVDGRASPGIGRALSYGSHVRPTRRRSGSFEELPILEDDHGRFVTTPDMFGRMSVYSRRSSVQGGGQPARPKTAGEVQSSSMRRQPPGRVPIGDVRESVLLPSPPSSAVLLTPTHSNSSFTFTPATPRASIPIFPLTAPPGLNASPLGQPPLAVLPPPPANERSQYDLSRVQSYFQIRPSTAPNAGKDTFGPSLTRKPSRPQIPKIEIPQSPPFSSNSSHLESPSSSSGGQDEVGPFAFPRAPVSATRSKARPDDVLNDNAALLALSPVSVYQKQQQQSQQQPNRPSYSRAPSSAVGGPFLQSNKAKSRISEASTIQSASPPKFATGPRVYSSIGSGSLMPNNRDSRMSSNTPTQMGLLPAASASKTSLISMSSNASSAHTALAAGLSAPPSVRQGSSTAAGTYLSSSRSASALSGHALEETKLQEVSPNTSQRPARGSMAPAEKPTQSIRPSYPKTIIPPVEEAAENTGSSKSPVVPKTPTSAIDESEPPRTSTETIRLARNRSRRRRRSSTSPDETQLERGNGYVFI